MNNFLTSLLDLLSKQAGLNDKSTIAALVAAKFDLTRDRSVYYSEDFAIRFSSSGQENFSNTVLSLSNLQKFDHLPFFVCLITPLRNYLYLSNSTFLRKISHSSQSLRQNNIRGSFNGSDIIRSFESISNIPENFERLFAIHEGVEFDLNLVRLVEATNNISPTGRKFSVSEDAQEVIMDAPDRAWKFVTSKSATELKEELDQRVKNFDNEILLASLIENVNVRGRVIEYLIAGRDEKLRSAIVTALHERKKGIPPFKTDNSLGDYTRNFEDFHTETDVKTKIMVLESNPKAYNLDKILEFLSYPKAVFMCYFIGVDPNKIAGTLLVSMFQEKLLSSTILLRHWAGRNSRGVSQFEGRTIKRLILNPEMAIDVERSRSFLKMLISL